MAMTVTKGVRKSVRRASFRSRMMHLVRGTRPLDNPTVLRQPCWPDGSSPIDYAPSATLDSAPCCTLASCDPSSYGLPIGDGHDLPRLESRSLVARAGR